jgi:hypothetical protein
VTRGDVQQDEMKNTRRFSVFVGACAWRATTSSWRAAIA